MALLCSKPLRNFLHRTTFLSCRAWLCANQIWWWDGGQAHFCFLGKGRDLFLWDCSFFLEWWYNDDSRKSNWYEWYRPTPVVDGYNLRIHPLTFGARCHTVCQAYSSKSILKIWAFKSYLPPTHQAITPTCRSAMDNANFAEAWQQFQPNNMTTNKPHHSGTEDFMGRITCWVVYEYREVSCPTISDSSRDFMGGSLVG